MSDEERAEAVEEFRRLVKENVDIPSIRRIAYTPFAAVQRIFAFGFDQGQASRKVEATPTDRDEDERILAWMEVSDHEAFAACYEEERPLIESVMDRLTYLVSMEQAVTELMPSQPVQVEVTDEMVDRAAAAMWELRRRASEPKWAGVDYGLRLEYEKDARAALTAALTPPVAESEATNG